MANAASAFLLANLIVAVKANEGYEEKEDCVSPKWQTAAIGLAILLTIIGIIAAVKKCMARLLGPKVVASVEDEHQISIISNGLVYGCQNGKGNISNMQGSFATTQTASKQLSLDINLARTGPMRSPNISVQPATPSCDCVSENGQRTAEPAITEWVASTPPPPPPGTLLWVPSTARRRSVSLRGDSDEENEKSTCSSCGGSISPTPTPNASPPGSMTLERKRSVTFNQNVEEIHVLSSERKAPRSRSPSKLFSAPFYCR